MKSKLPVNNMQTQIEVWNGGGWNNYTALRTLFVFPVGTKGLLKQNGIQRLEVSPRDADKPFGISARYYDANGELVFTQVFDQHDSADWIRKRVVALLKEGIQARINARAAKLAREVFVKRITAWRRNFDAAEPSATKSGNKLRAKFGALREVKTGPGRMSRKQCWTLTNAVIAGEMTYQQAVAKFQ